MDRYSFLDWKKNEVVFVIAVLLVLFGVSFLQLRIGQQKTRDAQRHADLELVGRALNAYLGDHKQLPRATSDGRIISCGGLGGKPCEWDTGPMFDSEGVSYINKLPIEPFSSKGWQYVYTVSADRQHYTLYTHLEYSRDPQYRSDLTVTCGNLVQCNWYVKN